MRRKLLALLLAACMVLPGLSGCGGQPSDVPPSQSGQTQQQEEPQTPLDDGFTTAVGGRVEDPEGLAAEEQKTLMNRLLTEWYTDIALFDEPQMANLFADEKDAAMHEASIRTLNAIRQQALTDLRMQDVDFVLTVTKAEEDVEAIAADICAVLDDALTAYNEMRAVEGAKLAEDVGSRADTIEETVARVEQRSPETVAAYRQRLETKMMEVLQSATIDESRILTEAAIFADKVAVDEETVRLHSHMAQLRTMLAGDIPVGRKLDFLVQEINRECNTIGSKCNDLAIAQDVVNMKAEVEKIREQVQNIE